MSTTFISDLHLSATAPDISKRFTEFANHLANTEKLYILGDLFEYWIGDDAAELVGMNPILDILKSFTDSGVEGYFIRGNRDFLIGDEFSQATGFKLLDDESIIDLYGEPVLILHGDSLCSDDKLHQQFREQMMCNPQWHQFALSHTVEERIAMAEKMRGMSADHKASISNEIMDVNAKTVTDVLEKHQVKRMIHGHTHRPAIHQHKTLQGNATRIVLGDWYTQSSVLTVTADREYQLSNLS